MRFFKNTKKRIIVIGLIVCTYSTFFQNLAAQNNELNTQGLYYAEFYDYIYRGHFEHIKITRNSADFVNIFDSYLKAYGGQCASYLPENKVPIMVDRCQEWLVEKDFYGNEISRTCTSWTEVESGLYAKPDLYNTKERFVSQVALDVAGAEFGILFDENAIGNSVDKIHKIKGLKADMQQFFRLNGCKGAVLELFEKNLKAFALQTKPTRLTSQSMYQKVKNSGGPTGNQNYNRLLNDLVANQSKTWAMNRYVTNSVNGVRVTARDGQSRPREVIANYSYSSMFGSSKGSVRVTFENGLPTCMYFFDFPRNCKTPNSSIVASYATGNYRM